jgi:hypothetical protein
MWIMLGRLISQLRSLCHLFPAPCLQQTAGVPPDYTPQVFLYRFSYSVVVFRGSSVYFFAFVRMTMLVPQWIEEEFANVSFGDARLDKRLKVCVAEAECFGESPPERSKSKSSLKATYRFASNQKVGMDQILREHNESSIARCVGKRRVYLAQDTTEFDLTKPNQQVHGAGTLGTNSRFGFFFHPLYAIDQDGLPLGVVDQVVWTRDPASLEFSSKEREAFRRRACYEEKESSRWLEMLQSGEQIARTMPETQFVMVSDSESDLLELFGEADDLADNFDFIIRGFREHNITSALDVGTQEVIAAPNVDEAFKQAKARFEITVEVSSRDAPVMPDDKNRKRKQARPSRQATLSVRTIQTTLKGPRRPGGDSLKDVTINIVQSIEENPPPGEEPICWVLYTTLAIDSIEETKEVLDGYQMRWSIEEFFKTLKSGMKVEDMKYEELSRYSVAFAILLVVGWRVEYIKRAARTDPDASAEKYFEPYQWIAVVVFVTKKRPDPAQPPTMSEFISLIAQLGGYINKKSQGPPGSITIWRGMRQFDTITQAYKTFVETCGV